jgi:hypothetical protein
MVTRNLASDVQSPFEIANAVNSLLDGKVNSTGQVTLTPNAATTVLSDRRIGGSSAVFLTPLTLSAMTNGLVYVDTYVKGAATIHHGVSVATDMTFMYAVLG